MKPFVALSVILGILPTLASAAATTPSYLRRDEYGRYDTPVTNYRTTTVQTSTRMVSTPAQSANRFYVAARAELSFLNWSNKYDSNIELDTYKESFSFKPVFGGSLAYGRQYTPQWRGEIEAGYIGYFSDKDEGAEFSLSIPYIMLNGYYDFANGLYVGGGAGVAATTTTVDESRFTAGERSRTAIGPVAGLMAGYVLKMDDNLKLDFRYRIAGVYGSGAHTRHWVGEDNKLNWYETKIGFVLDNSISVGLRYEF